MLILKNQYLNSFNLNPFITEFQVPSEIKDSIHKIPVSLIRFHTKVIFRKYTKIDENSYKIIFRKYVLTSYSSFLSWTIIF